MPSFGSLFPNDIRENFGERTIIPGSVLKINATNTTPPKPKRLVVLAICENEACVGYLFLNSEVNQYLFRTQELRDLHLPMSADECEYLDHDSFLDCSDIKNISLDELKGIIASDPGKHIGHLSRADLEQARETVKNAPTIPVVDKRKYNLL